MEKIEITSVEQVVAMVRAAAEHPQVHRDLWRAIEINFAEVAAEALCLSTFAEVVDALASRMSGSEAPRVITTLMMQSGLLYDLEDDDETGQQLAGVVA